MLCAVCGKQIDVGSPFCSGCGAPAARVAPRSKTNPVVIIVAAVVAIFGILFMGGIVAAIVIPNLAGARIRSQEMIAIQSIRSINTAEVQYLSQYGRYAGSLSELGLGAAGTKSGYTYELHASPTGYTLNANPVNFGSTGRRTFFSDESLVIRAHFGPEPATAASREIPQ